MTADLLMYNKYLTPLNLDAVPFYCCFYCMSTWEQAGECQLAWQVFWQTQLLKHMNLQRAAAHFGKQNIAFRVHLNVNIRTKQKLCLILSKGTVWHFRKDLFDSFKGVRRMELGWQFPVCSCLPAPCFTYISNQVWLSGVATLAWKSAELFHFIYSA